MISANPKARGFIVLEVLVSAAIIIPILTALALSVKVLCANYIKIEMHHNDLYNFIKISELVENILADVDLHPFDIMPRVHSNGVIRLANGSMNKINNSRTFRPKPSSDAITYLKMDISGIFKIDKRYYNGAINNFYSCLLFTNSFNQQSYNSFLILGTSGFQEIKLKRNVTRIPNSNCFNFSAEFSNSMMFKPPQEQITAFETAQFIIPVKGIYTLYLDSANTLRYLSHYGEDTIENQPILENAKDLKFLITKNLSNLVEVQFGYLKTRRQKLEFTFINQLRRESFYNFLLNLQE